MKLPSLKNLLNETIKKILIEDVTKTAEKVFGTTNNPKEAGYVTPDGKMLDFSGKKIGGTPGVRSLDHREISKAYIEEKSPTPNVGVSVSASSSMEDFIKKGNIRVGLLPTELYLQVGKIPTLAQLRVIADMCKHTDFASLDINISGQSVSVEIEHPNANKIINAIKNPGGFGEVK
jgi:hypothetical protein